jgi:hypothetical protein
MTPLEMCQTELVEAKCPTPDFLGEDLTPGTILYWLFEAAKVAMTAVNAAAISLDVPEGEEQPVMTEVMNGTAQALVGYTYALVKLEVLPQAALDAISTPACSAGPGWGPTVTARQASTW